MRILYLFIFSTVIWACEQPAKPVFKSLENVTFNSFSIQRPYSITFNADVIYHNPNSLGADITEMDFDVFVNEQKVTHITQSLRASMPARSDFTLPLELKIPLEEVFQDLSFKDLLNSKTIDYEMVGHFKMGLGEAMIKVPFSYEGQERLGL